MSMEDVRDAAIEKAELQAEIERLRQDAYEFGQRWLAYVKTQTEAEATISALQSELQAANDDKLRILRERDEAKGSIDVLQSRIRVLCDFGTRNQAQIELLEGSVQLLECTLSDLVSLADVMRQGIVGSDNSAFYGCAALDAAKKLLAKHAPDTGKETS